MKDFGAAGCQCVRFIITQVVEKFSLGGDVRISGIEPIHVSPNDELFGIHDVSNNRTGKIGAIAAERGNTTVGSGADEACNDRNEAIFKKREENAAAPLSSLLQMRLGIAEGIASEDELRGGNGNSGDAGLFESGSEKTRAETLSKGSETIGEFGGGSNAALLRHLVEEVASEELDHAANAILLLFANLEILEHIQVEMDDAFGFITSVGELAFGKEARDREKTIRDGLHRRDDDDDV
jgi:hypothetical protein